MATAMQDTWLSLVIAEGRKEKRLLAGRERRAEVRFILDKFAESPEGKALLAFDGLEKVIDSALDKADEHEAFLLEQAPGYMSGTPAQVAALYIFDTLGLPYP